jgi:para-aminobenzoate synthetase component 1
MVRPMVYNKKEGIAKLNYLAQNEDPWFFMVDYPANRWFIVPLDQLDSWNVSYRAQSPIIPPQWSTGLSLTADSSEAKKKPVSIESAILPSLDVYAKAFNIVQLEEKKGNSFLCNLTFGSEVKLRNGTLYDAFKISGGLCNLYVGDQRITPNPFVVFSPERFIRITESVIESCPMKGTIEYDDPDNDTQILAELLHDSKEDAEHRTIVDLIRNDLGIVSSRVWVESYRYGQKITLPNKYLWTTSSTIKGQLSDSWRKEFGDILNALLPAGSITGAPKKETCRIISDAEIEPRGFYTGVAGIGGPWGVDSWVLIRFLEQHKKTYKFRSGGGITIYSELEKEYKELEAKIGIPRE